MNEVIANIPWVYTLPTIAIAAFLGGLAWKKTQDKTVEIVKSLTIKPGDLRVSELQEYARTNTT